MFRKRTVASIVGMLSRTVAELESHIDSQAEEQTRLAEEIAKLELKQDLAADEEAKALTIAENLRQLLGE